MKKTHEKNVIKDLIQAWDASGYFALYSGDTLEDERTFGYGNRDEAVVSPDNPTYLLSRRSHFLQALAVLLLVDQKRLRLDDPITKIIPEYHVGNGITVKHLLMHESGIPDYFYGGLMVEKSMDVAHNALSAQERFIVESQWFYERVDFEQVLGIIKEERLFEAGAKDYWSATNHVFIEKIIERITGKSMGQFMEENIFTPLGLRETVRLNHANTMSYVCMRDVHLLKAPYKGDASLVWTTSPKDLSKLMHGLKERKLLSKALWDEALKPNKRGEALMCHYRNGMEYYGDTCLGYTYSIYHDAPTGVSFLHVSNEQPKYKLVDGNWRHFMAQIREHIEGYITYPVHPYLDGYHERNAWDVMALKTDPSQHEFVIDVKTSLCWGFSEVDEKRPYVLMEGYRAIGFMMLAIDPKRTIYDVDILIVDARYQARGYGKIMLEAGLDILKAEGAKKIDIEVSRFNEPAIKLYLRLGFKETGIYESGIRLTKVL